MFQTFAGYRQLPQGLAELRARPITEPRARPALSQGGKPSSVLAPEIGYNSTGRADACPESRAFLQTKHPAFGFPRYWHQFFPLEWWNFPETLRAVRERSREAQVVVFGSGVVKTFIMKRRSFVI